jgi:hypothetical protein
MLILLGCILGLSACSKFAEVCSLEGSVFLSFTENRDKWWAYFNENPDDDYLRIEIDNHPLVVRVYRQQNSLLLITNEGMGPSAALPGEAGYFWVDPNSGVSPIELYVSSSEFVVTYLSDNIYCYHQ